MNQEKSIKQKAREAKTDMEFDAIVGQGAKSYYYSIFNALRKAEADSLYARVGSAFGDYFDAQDNRYEFQETALGRTLEKYGHPNEFEEF